MIIQKVPEGTRIYLRKSHGKPLYMRPNQTITADTLYVAYDVRIDGVTVIPRGTRVQGDWITESTPTFAAQLQIHRIFLELGGQDISADSDVIETITAYNSNEIASLPFVSKVSDHINGAKSNQTHRKRIVKYGNRIKALRDTNVDSIYIEIQTREIPVTITRDFIPFPCFPDTPDCHDYASSHARYTNRRQPIHPSRQVSHPNNMMGPTHPVNHGCSTENFDCENY